MGETERDPTSAHHHTLQVADRNGNKVVGTQEPAIVSLTDTTTGTAGDTVDDPTASVKDDIASLAAKIEEVLVVLRNHGLIAT